jgi:RNA 2',3'-cyclic 3'-phosphodiesterase
MSLIRAFIAIELPEGLKKELAELETQLKRNSPPVVKWVDPNNIHITLKFLGEISADSIGELMLAIEESTSGIHPFKLEIREIGAFPNLERVGVIWVGIKGEMEKIAQLQKRIESNTEQLGFPRESRVFTPHLTLGRVRDEARPNERMRLGKLLADTHFTALHNVEVIAVNLMKSQLTPAGPIYTCIGSMKLK